MLCKRVCCLGLWMLVVVCGARAAALPHVEVRGHGSVQVVLIPCGGCDWRSWETFLERNSELYTMHAVTLPGMGGSTPPPIAKDAKGTPLFDHYVAAVAGYIRQRALQRPVLIGHSVGAVVALKLMLAEPGLISQLILVDWGAVPPAMLNLTMEARQQRAEQRRAETLAMTDEAFQTQWARRAPEMIANAARVPVYATMFGLMNRQASAQGSYEMGMIDLRSRLREIRVPVLALFGLPAEVDPAQKRTEAAAVTQGLRHLQLMFVPDAGHWIMEDRPAEFDRHVKEFLVPRQRPRTTLQPRR